MSKSQAKLYLAATPIGNLDDISLRTVKTLNESDLVICEDTRRTLILLNHLDLKKRLISCHAQTSSRKIESLARLVQSLEVAVFVTDGGTPGVSDPGAGLVRACRELEVGIYPLPGPSALTAGLSVSGFPSNDVLFLGFLPIKNKKRERILKTSLKNHTVVVCYESPWRIRALLESLVGFELVCEVLIAREMTKIHEEYIFWESGKDLPDFPEKGEFTVLIHPKKSKNS